MSRRIRTSLLFALILTAITAAIAVSLRQYSIDRLSQGEMTYRQRFPEPVEYLPPGIHANFRIVGPKEPVTLEAPAEIEIHITNTSPQAFYVWKNTTPAFPPPEGIQFPSDWGPRHFGISTKTKSTMKFNVGYGPEEQLLERKRIVAIGPGETIMLPMRFTAWGLLLDGPGVHEVRVSYEGYRLRRGGQIGGCTTGYSLPFLCGTWRSNSIEVAVE
jgi:hypothetical protein